VSDHPVSRAEVDVMQQHRGYIDFLTQVTVPADLHVAAFERDLFLYASDSSTSTLEWKVELEENGYIAGSS
jgi:hypothetical protein